MLKHPARLALCSLFLTFVLSFSLVDAQPLDSYLRMPRLGITFISSAEHPADESRYRNALLLGAGWNRWPMYWNVIDGGVGYDWSAYDRLVQADLEHGLRINAILLGIAGHQREGGSVHCLRHLRILDHIRVDARGPQPLCKFDALAAGLRLRPHYTELHAQGVSVS